MAGLAWRMDIIITNKQRRAHACVGEHVFFLKILSLQWFSLSFAVFYPVFERRGFLRESGSATWVEISCCMRKEFSILVEAGIRKTSFESFRELFRKLWEAVRGLIVKR